MKWSLIAALCLVLVVSLGACSRTPDEAVLRATLEGMAAAAVEGRPSGVLDGIAEDFTGNNGELDRGALERLVRAQLLARSLSVRTSAVEVQLHGERATVDFRLHLVDSSGRWIPGRGATLEVSSGWRREGRAWRVYNAGWTTQQR